VKSVLMAVIVVGLLSACTSGDPKPNLSTVTTSSAPSSTISESPSVATTGPNVLPGARPPVMPDFAKRRTADGAVVFVSYVIHALDWGYSTSDSTLYRLASDDSCTQCEAAMNMLDDLRRSGGRFQGGHLNVLSVGDGPINAKVRQAERAILVKVHQGSLRVLDSHGTTVAGPYPERDIGFVYYVRWGVDGWKIVKSEGAR
jgi:uncharacterized protein DUF6318